MRRQSLLNQEYHLEMERKKKIAFICNKEQTD